MWQSDFVEDLLCCLDIPTGTTGEQIFTVLDSYITKSGLDWHKCKGITTDGAANMTGKNSGVVKRIQDAAGEDITWNHCFIHRQALACKGMPCDLQNTMTEVIRVVNHIKSSALNSRLFHELCVDMGAEHTHLLFHTQVRWLSKGKVLSRVYELIHEIHSFLLEKNSPLADLFTDSWTLTVAYLSDIFSSLNDLNVKLQGQHDDLFNNWRHVYAFQKSLQLWLARLKQPNPSYYMFPTMLKHIEEHNVALREVMQLNKAIQAHLAALTANFERYYPQERRETLNAKRWIQNPFEFESPESLLALGLTPDEEAELLQLTSDQTLKQRYARTTLSCFWISVSSEFPTLSKRSVLLLLPFTTTYKCELGFSALTKIKTKYRNKLDAAPDMRVALSTLTPDWDALVKTRQAHMSH
ncbi:hypothetical protein WMY93_023300 [Mugilogobius chulae]|uniref:Transposase n=1 Tax=Mugilogobius chulae TaxID=88201 RepID=A0AAW0N9G9_9GOBI